MSYCVGMSLGPYHLFSQERFERWLLRRGHFTAQQYWVRGKPWDALQLVWTAYLSIVLHLIPGVRQYLMQRRALIVSNWWHSTVRHWWPMTRYIWFYGKCP